MTHLDQNFAEYFNGAHHDACTHATCLIADLDFALLWQLHQVGGHERQETFTQLSHNFFCQHAWVGSALNSGCSRPECTTWVSVDNCFDKFIRRKLFVCFAATCCHKLECRQRVTCRPATLCQHLCNCRFAYFEIGIFNYPSHVFVEVVHWQQMKLQVLGTTTNCLAYFLRISCGQHKHHMWRWFFKRLEQRSLCWLREHVHFVQNKHTMTARVAKRRTLNQVAHVFDTVVAGCVKFKNVVAVAAINSPTRVADAARFTVFGFFAVEHLGQNARS